MSATADRLLHTLDALVALLEGEGEAYWAAWMRRAREQIKDGDAAGLSRVLGAYGGMGSLNDLVVGQTYVDGVFAWTDDAAERNETLSALRHTAWTLAHALRGERPA